MKKINLEELHNRYVQMLTDKGWEVAKMGDLWAGFSPPAHLGLPEDLGLNVASMGEDAGFARALIHSMICYEDMTGEHLLPRALLAGQEINFLTILRMVLSEDEGPRAPLLNEKLRRRNRRFHFQG